MNISNLRKNGPNIARLNGPKLPKAERILLNNGMEVYFIEGGKQDVVKLELVFEAGRPYELKNSVSKICGRLLKEGTHRYTSKEIAVLFENYGATLGSSAGMDTIAIKLYCLSKDIHILCEPFLELAMNSSFPEEEFTKSITQSLQQLQIDLSKNEVVAYREVTERIFGATHPYGYNSSTLSFEALTLDDVKKHYRNNIGSNNCKVMISGKFSDDQKSKIVTTLQGFDKQVDLQIRVFPEVPSNAGRIELESANNLQSAIKVGRHLFNRKHEDYNSMFFLTTVLGGYFGSRLMNKLREEKGYTYGVHSTLDTLIHDGYFFISTEVGNEFKEQTLLEIRKEMDLLKSDLVPVQELDMVKNYLIGNIMSMLDGPFNSSQIFKSLAICGMEQHQFDQLISDIETMSAQKLRDVANKYLDYDKMWKVISG